MKKFATVLTAIVMLFTTAAFAAGGDNVVTAKVKAAFQTDFSGAQKVDWEKTSDFYFASFLLNNVRVDAAYNEDGDLVGTSRRVLTSQVPLNVSLVLTKKYSDYSIEKGALELSYEGETSYYVTAENDKQVLKLKCSSNGEISVEKRTKK